MFTLSDIPTATISILGIFLQLKIYSYNLKYQRQIMFFVLILTATIASLVSMYLVRDTFATYFTRSFIYQFGSVLFFTVDQFSIRVRSTASIPTMHTKIPTSELHVQPVETTKGSDYEQCSQT